MAIIGAGAAGLAAAWWLRREGLSRVTVLELDSKIGGTAQGAETEVSAYPWGAHYIVTPTGKQPELIELLREVGALGSLQAEGNSNGAPQLLSTARCEAPEERIYHAGRWHEGLYLHAGASEEDRQQYRQFSLAINRWVSFRDDKGLRGFDLPASLGSQAAPLRALDTISFGTWLDRQGLVSERLRWLTNYACRDDYGLVDSETSAWAGIFYFASRMNVPDSESRPVATWPEGNARLIRQMAQGLGSRLRLEHAVADVQNTENGVELRTHGPNGSLAIRAQHAIVATPGLMTNRISTAFRNRSPQAIKRDRGAWAVANLHLSSPPRSALDQCGLAWDNVLRNSKSLGYVVANHKQLQQQAAGPQSNDRSTVLTWYYPFTGDGSSARRSLDTATREDWASAALSDIAQAHPEIHGLCKRIDVAYWGHGMVRPRPGHIFNSDLQEEHKPIGRLHFANTELSGLALFEEAFAHGIRAAREVLAALAQARETKG